MDSWTDYAEWLGCQGGWVGVGRRDSVNHKGTPELHCKQMRLREPPRNPTTPQTCAIVDSWTGDTQGIGWEGGWVGGGRQVSHREPQWNPKTRQTFVFVDSWTENIKGFGWESALVGVGR